MRRCIAAVLLVLSLEALAAGRLSAAVADDRVDTIRLPSNGLADEVATEIGAEKRRPWKCCDSPLCSRSIPPRCRCMDAVEHCDEACTRCEASQSDSSKHVCNDRYHGWPGPNCTDPDDIPSGPGVSGPPVVSQATEAGEETSVVGGEEKPRPWKCCDEAICTMSFPPICFCRDRVKKCAKTCNKCDKDESDASRHVCGDSYFGWPGPRCTNPDDGHVPSGTGPGVSGPPVVGQEAAVSEEIAVDGEKPRPWKCCDQTLCTRSAPPTCFCHDKVKKCPKTCKNCLKDESGTSLRVCGDPYFGWPGPKCHKI
ncbi:Bowman-Birk type bran trypsin inhibitor isoform X1 [Aegilops tauschii subsp. strangulata]|uniref:Bowman-Birk type bran trypsin inhibitor isoform X1 n=1 Tax=Aegilops tauschii subsp. strangulata TaxID=200361 RepID=UPI00098B1731|nr:Bowman-Birk type bran trypsin inhibitor isoform X1 [Aegilops tauschii subsp. strangulata]